MKVSELIDELKKWPQDAEVVVDYDNGYEIQPIELYYYPEYYPTDFDRLHRTNVQKNVLVHHC